jgi:hypothetical protein
LFVIGNSIPFLLVLDSFEIQQTQIFALFPVFVGFFSDVDGRPVRNDVRPLVLARPSPANLAPP